MSNMTQTMRVKVEFTLEIDVDAWTTEYGVESSDVRRDVKEHVEQSVLAHLGALEVLA